jgi:hypothetical protein
MKAKTKLQRQVVQLAQDLLGLSKSEKLWVYDKCLEHRAYATKNSVLCLDCGESFSPTLVVRKKAVCPHCNTKVEVKQSRCRTDQQVNYFAIAEIVEDFQVIRNYEIIAHYKKGQPVKYLLHEILQYWVLPNGKTTIYGLKHNSNWCMDSWSGDMEIRIAGNSYWNHDKYDVYPRLYHPRSDFKKEYKKHGIDKNLRGINFLEAIKYIPHHTIAETLLKIKQYSLLEMYCGSKGGNVNQYWPTLKICFRNKYKINDASIYFDYLDLLRYFRKDLRNAKFVCPKNLKAEHDKLMEKKRAILRKQELEREEQARLKRQQNLERAITEYVELFNKFFDLEFKDRDLSITPLKSVEEFKTEGDELNHCLYTNEYYLKNDSLCLSAKIDGKRTETIEFILSKMKVEQCRGMNNQPTEYHDRIVNLVNRSIPKIRQVLKKSKPKKVKEPIQKSA